MNDDGSPGALGSNDQLGLQVVAYEAGDGVQIEACKQRDGSRLWAVRDSTGYVLSRSRATETPHSWLDAVTQRRLKRETPTCGICRPNAECRGRQQP